MIDMMLLIALLIVSAIALGLSYVIGGKWWDNMKTKKQLRKAIAERDAAKAEHERCYQGAMELSDKVASLESERLTALEKIGQQKESIDKFETEILELGLRAETAETHLKDAQQAVVNYKALQATSNERIDQLTAEVKALKAEHKANQYFTESLQREAVNCREIIKQARALLAKAE